MTELSLKLRELTTAIDNALVAHHGLKHALKDDHPPFMLTSPDMSAMEKDTGALKNALAHYGRGPLFDLWSACRAMEALRIAWTGKP